MKQKIYALDAFFIEKLKLSENDPFTFKERHSGLFCPIFLKFTFDNFTSPVRLAILKFNLPGPKSRTSGLYYLSKTVYRTM